MIIESQAEQIIIGEISYHASKYMLKVAFTMICNLYLLFYMTLFFSTESIVVTRGAAKGVK